MKSGLVFSLIWRTISFGKRIRFSKDPPHSSVLLFVSEAINSLMRYPSDPMTSTPSYPAAIASFADLTKSLMVRLTPLRDNARGLNLLMGDLIADGATANGV